MSHIETIALVTLGTVVLVIQLLRHPRPVPKLAAEPLSVTLRTVAATFGYFFFLSAVAEVLPHEFVLPAIVVITVVALVAYAWWYRRHPRSDRDGLLLAPAIVPQSADEVAFSTADWVRGVVPVVVIGGIVLVVVAIASAIAAPH